MYLGEVWFTVIPGGPVQIFSVNCILPSVAPPVCRTEPEYELLLAVVGGCHGEAVVQPHGTGGRLEAGGQARRLLVLKAEKSGNR